jgi:hypothetical protein
MYLRHDDANPATHDDKEQAMNIVPTRVQEAVNGVDRTRALVMGILSGLAAFFALWKIFWLVFGVATLSGLGYVGYSGLWLIVGLLWWGAIAALGVFWSVAFLRRYSAQP